MLSTPHILVGGAIVKSIPNPFISIPLAFLSHLIFDFIPHADFSPSLKPKIMFYVFVDYAIGLLFLFWLSLGDPDQTLIILGGISATVPDFISASLRLFNLRFLKALPLNTFHNFHMKVQNRSKSWGALFSIITILISVYILTS
jgi:hypothetical protein